MHESDFEMQMCTRRQQIKMFVGRHYLEEFEIPPHGGAEVSQLGTECLASGAVAGRSSVLLWSNAM